jgi:hypothetical protein
MMNAGSTPTTPSRTVPLVALLVYAALVITLEMHHEPWRDEADPWLLARDADMVTFFHRMGLAGTPGLWHTLLVPLARTGLPYGSQAVLHIIIAICTAAIILWRSPFPIWLRIAIIFCYYLSYEYSVVVRSYALGILFLFGVAALYPRRFEKPVIFGLLVALLANCNTHSLIIAAMIGAGYAIEGILLRQRWLVGAAVMLIGGLAAAAQVYPPPDSIARTSVMLFTPQAVPLAMSAAFFPSFPFAGSAIAGGVVIAIVAFALRKDRVPLLVLCGTYAGLAFLYIYKWIGGFRHTGFVLLVLLYALWTSTNNDRSRLLAQLVLFVTLLVSIAATFRISQLELKYAFSGAEEMAGFIRQARLEAMPIASHSETTTSAICPWIPHPFWYAGSQRLGTFTMWDQQFERGLEVTYPDAVANAKRHFAGKDYLLLLNVEMPDPASNGFALLHQTSVPVFAHQDERFWLYRPLH